MTALVTGGSAGIGREFAKQLGVLGYRTMTVARRDADLLADLTTEDGLLKVESFIHECSDLEVLVNNAGFGTVGRFWEADLDGQRRMHDLHVSATVRLTYAALQTMTKRNAGRVINVSSVAAFSRSPGNVSYCATKAWMNAFTEGLAIELREIGSRVEVQALCPGFTRTSFHDAMGVDARGIPGWLWMSAERVVSESLRSHRMVVIPGKRYKVAAAFLAHMPWALRSRLRRPGKDSRV